jgi:hypothetical protein
MSYFVPYVPEVIEQNVRTPVSVALLKYNRFFSFWQSAARLFRVEPRLMLMA